MTASVRAIRPQPMAALAASSVGTWEYDLASDLVYLDPFLSSLFGLATVQGEGGILLEALRATIKYSGEQQAHSVPAWRGNVFVRKFRITDPAGMPRRLLARGRLERDADDKPALARGVVLDITGSPFAESADGGASAGRADGEDVAVLLDRATDQALALHATIRSLGPAARRALPHLAELLLHELGVQLASQMPDQA